MRILLISDIHGNYPALRAVESHFSEAFDLILNGGDTTVYAPFPNETVDWLRARHAVSILGNTDRLVASLLRGRSFRKPGKPEKRIMYGWTAAELSPENRRYLLSLGTTAEIPAQLLDDGSGTAVRITMYHGSPADPDEFLFADTPRCRFRELAALASCDLATVGHSHSQFHVEIGGTHFVNPGSVGRMFDGETSAGCAVLTIEAGRIDVELHRIAYPVEPVIAELRRLRFPEIYAEMYRRGRKLN